MCWTIFKDTIEWLSQLVTIVGIGIAYYGLTLWKKQMLWQKTHEIGSELLVKVYLIQDCINTIRNSNFMSNRETIESQLDKINKLFSELRVIELRCKNIFKEQLSEKINNLSSLYEKFVDKAKFEQSESQKNVFYKHATQDTSPHLEYNYKNYEGNGDKFSNDLNKIVKEIETIVLPLIG